MSGYDPPTAMLSSRCCGWSKAHGAKASIVARLTRYTSRSSTKNANPSRDQSTRYTCQAATSRAGSVNRVPLEYCLPSRPSEWVPAEIQFRAPMFSITSISPHAGQLATFAPSVQNAGQAPGSAGNFIRADTLPYVKSSLPFVLRRAEAKS
jgi:hypothetical protein